MKRESPRQDLSYNQRLVFRSVETLLCLTWIFKLKVKGRRESKIFKVRQAWVVLAASGINWIVNAYRTKIKEKHTRWKGISTIVHPFSLQSREPFVRKKIKWFHIANVAGESERESVGNWLPYQEKRIGKNQANQLLARSLIISWVWSKSFRCARRETDYDVSDSGSPGISNTHNCISIPFSFDMDE